MAKNPIYTPESGGKLTGNTCQCEACGEIFQTVNGFDKHRAGRADKRHCLSPDEMRGIGMVINASNRWGASEFTRNVS